MGNHLVDALLLGAGIAYTAYAPSALDKMRYKVGSLLNKVGLKQATPKIGEVLTVITAKDKNNETRIMVCRVQPNGLETLSQQLLPQGTEIDTPGSQETVDYAVKQMMSRLDEQIMGRTERILIDPRLQRQSTALRGNSSVEIQTINTSGYSRDILKIDADQMKSIAQWGNGTISDLDGDSATTQILKQRLSELLSYGYDDRSKAIATLELSIAVELERNRRQGP